MSNNTSNCCCVVLNYNDYDTTSTLLSRISSYRVFSHIIVVDNFSTDDSYGRLLRLSNENIVVVRSEKNGGYGYGNNFGIRLAVENYKASFVLVVNPDVVFTEDTVKALLNIMQDDIAVSSCVQLDSDHKSIKCVAWKCPTYCQYVFSSLYLFSKIQGIEVYHLEDYTNFEYIYVDCVPGSLLLINTKAFENSGCYDEEVFLYCEESILGLKVKEKGYKTVLLLNKNYVHNHSISINKSIKSILTQRKLLYGSRLIYIKKYLKVNSIKILLAKFIFGISIFEEHCKVFIKHFLK